MSYHRRWKCLPITRTQGNKERTNVFNGKRSKYRGDAHILVTNIRGTFGRQDCSRRMVNDGGRDWEGEGVVKRPR